MDIVDKFVNLSIRVGSTIEALSKVPENLSCVLMIFQATSKNPLSPTVFEAQIFLQTAGSWLSLTPDELVQAANLVRPPLFAHINLNHLFERVEKRRKDEREKRRLFALQKEKENEEKKINKDDDIKYMKEAMDCARAAEESGEVPVGAVVVDEKGVIIGRGFNKVIGDADPTAHAEIMAIRQAAKVKKNYRLENCTLYVTLEPCPMCAGAIMNSRFSRLVYGASDEKAGVVDNVCKLFSYPTLNHHTKTTSGICSQDCLKLLRDFFEKKRKKESSN
ncbi:tRNA adenosine(34) deaminase TadA [Turicimonas muris]|uniref:tRNA adenosine(34) deaminase TadA n=3 Tax=Turicimonas muris TaxID=1796652 RepID=UPI000836FF04|nr:tRNA adenosine(34) deaminase TadA [Turicimonas muris]